jgi:hypothetical protein
MLNEYDNQRCKVSHFVSLIWKQGNIINTTKNQFDVIWLDFVFNRWGWNYDAKVLCSEVVTSRSFNHSSGVYDRTNWNVFKGAYQYGGWLLTLPVLLAFTSQNVTLRHGRFADDARIPLMKTQHHRLAYCNPTGCQVGQSDGLDSNNWWKLSICKNWMKWQISSYIQADLVKHGAKSSLECIIWRMVTIIRLRQENTVPGRKGVCHTGTFYYQENVVWPVLS